MPGESAYRFILRMLEEYPGTPYRFQDLEYSGRRDVAFSLWRNELPEAYREKMAFELSEILRGMEDNGGSRELLQEFILPHPLFLYLQELRKRLRLLISEGLLEAETLYKIGVALATECEQAEEVKLGLFLLGFSENDLSLQILRIMGMHSEFTLYALEAATAFSRPNGLACEFAQGTSGFGKLAAIHYFEPLKEKEKLWLFHEGSLNEVQPGIAALRCLENLNMKDFFAKLELTDENFTQLARLYTYSLEEKNIRDLPYTELLLERFLAKSTEHVFEFVHLSALIMITKSITETNKQIIPTSKSTEKRLWKIKEQCRLLLNKQNRHALIRKELNNPREQLSIILKVLGFYGITPPFSTLFKLIKSDYFDFELLSFLLIQNQEVYLEDTFKYLCCILPEEIWLEGEKTITGEELSPDHKPDVWLVYLLQALRKARINKEEFFLRCLTARFQDVRIEALRALRSIKIEWSPEVITRLEQALELEKNENIKKRIKRLLGIKVYPFKEQRYIETPDMFLYSGVFDEELLKSSIAGSFFYDLECLEDRLNKGDLLYLMHEKDNEYDPNAVVVATEEGYVLGYLPSRENILPSSLLDEGERLYAVLESADLRVKKPEIRIMVSRSFDSGGKLVKFPQKYI